MACEHEIGPSDEKECVCGDIHVYCHKCMTRMTPCPIYDAPMALRAILGICQKNPGEVTDRIAKIAETIISPPPTLKEQADDE